MNNVQNRIEKLGEYFKEMQVTDVDGTYVIYVVVTFPLRWIIEEDVEKKYDVAVREGSSAGEFYFCAGMEIGFERVFDAIDYCVSANRDAMERANLFQTKINELKEIFGNVAYSLDKLKTLEFTFPPQKKGYKKKSPIDEVAEKETKKEEEK